MKGLDKLKGKFEVIWEMNGHCYPNEAIKQGVKEKFDFDQAIDEPTTPESKPFSDFLQSKEDQYTTKGYVWNHPLAKMEVEHSPQADMEQTEGRFLREDQIYKTIYRTHNVQIKPYPTRIYKSKKMMMKQEFDEVLDSVEKLTPTEQRLLTWIQEIDQDQEFTVQQAIGNVKSITGKNKGQNIDKSNMRRYLRKLVKLELIEKCNCDNKGKEDYFRRVI